MPAKNAECVFDTPTGLGKEWVRNGMESVLNRAKLYEVVAYLGCLKPSRVTVHGVKRWKSKAVFRPESEIGSVLDPFSAFDTRKPLENRCFTP